jgi:hypothetical protein
MHAVRKAVRTQERALPYLQRIMHATIPGPSTVPTPTPATPPVPPVPPEVPPRNPQPISPPPASPTPIDVPPDPVGDPVPRPGESERRTQAQFQRLLLELQLETF